MNYRKQIRKLKERVEYLEELVDQLDIESYRLKIRMEDLENLEEEDEQFELPTSEPPAVPEAGNEIDES
jgi:hypothetical protein